ncbi:MAG TPA: MFS transporter [Dongiaceae bacterium]|jgi:MFS family permease
MSEGANGAPAVSSAAPTWRDVLFGPSRRTVWTISIGVAIQAFGWFLISTIMPSVVLQLGRPEELSWGTTAFLALSVPGSASAGYLKHRFGARPVLLAAGSLVIASNLLGLLSPSMDVFLLSRAVQGLGEGQVLALCYILVGDSLAPREVSPAFAIVAVVWALATLIGPWLAGLLTAIASWRLAFTPLLLLAGTFLWLIATDRKLAERPATASGMLPLGRLAIIALTIGAVSFAGATRNFSLAAALLVVGIVLISLCFRLDRRSPSHLFPTRLLSLRDPSTLGIWILALMFGTEAAAPLYMAYFVQVGHGTSVFFAGQFSAITALAWSLSAIYISRYDKSVGQPMLILGPLLLTLGLAALMFWTVMPLYISAFALISLGAGFGLSYTFFTEYVIGLSPEGERDVTAGAIPTLENTCAAIGAALAGLLGNMAGFGTSGAADIPAAVPVAVFGVSALVSLFTFFCALRFYRLVSRT